MRLHVEMHGAHNLTNVHLLRRAGSPYVRGVVGSATYFESRVVEATLAPVWNEVCVVGCLPGERLEVQVVDRDAGKRTGPNLGAVDLGTVDDLEPAAPGHRLVTAPPGARCVVRKAGKNAPRYLPLTSATGGHGSDSAMLAIRATIAKRKPLLRP